ncbi:MAG: GIY-YIG nuclease family protein [Candidatus Moraniibacteriota bacterium]
MITVYALYDKHLEEIYVGMTNNLARRLSEHKRGQSFYTKKFKEFNLIFSQEFENYTDGRKKEKYLKHGSGKEFLRTLVQ